MMSSALAPARSIGMSAVDLEVDSANCAAVRLYERFSFSAVGSPGAKLRMRASLHGAGLETAETPIEPMEGAWRHYLKSAETEKLPNASVVSKQVICLPIYPALTDCDADRLVAVVHGVAVK